MSFAKIVSYVNVYVLYQYLHNKIMKQALLFIFLIIIVTTSAIAQIEMNSLGNVGIGGYSPINSYDLRASKAYFGTGYSGNHKVYSRMGIGTNWSSANTLTVSGLGAEQQGGGFGSSVNYVVYIGGGSYSGNSGYELYVNGSAKAAVLWVDSDKKLKKNIKNLDKIEIKEKLKQLRSTKYEYKSKEELLALHQSGEAKFHVDTVYVMDTVLLDNGRYDIRPTLDVKEIVVDVPHYKEGMTYGLIAQEVKEVFPELVKEDEKTGLHAIDYQGFIPLILDLVQNQQIQIESMEERLEKLEKKEKASSNSRSEESDNTGDNTNPSQGANLSQNSPNPFTDQTEIAFSLTQSTREASLYIYDLQGTQIRSYPINQRGSGSITIQANELKAGMYLYTLIADGQEVGTEKMILTK